VIVGVAIITAGLVFAILYRGHPTFLARRAFVSVAALTAVAILARGFTATLQLDGLAPGLDAEGAASTSASIAVTFGALSWSSLGLLVLVLALLFQAMRIEAANRR